MMCVSVRRTHADTFGTHPQWPCDTAAGRGLFDLLSGDTISGASGATHFNSLWRSAFKLMPTTRHDAIR